MAAESPRLDATSRLRDSKRNATAPVAAPVSTVQPTDSEALKKGELFGLREPLLADFSCALLDKIRYHGRMYLFASHIAFASTVFGDTKIVLPIAEVRSITRRKSVLVVPDAIEIVCGESWMSAAQCEAFVFAAFFNREQVFTTLERAWVAAQTSSAAVAAATTAAAAAAPAADPPLPESAAAAAPAPAAEQPVVLIGDVPTPPPSPVQSAAPVAAAEASEGADDAKAPSSDSPLPTIRNSSKIVRRATPMLAPVLPSLMPASESSAIPFVSAVCPHVANSAVDETFTSESATASTTIHQELPNCTLATVWHTLFKTTVFWRRVHARVAYFDFEGSPWRARFASSAPDDQQAPCCVERLITFKVKLNQPVGPKQTRMTQTLVARFVSPRRLVIETVSQCHDAPYADSFLVHSMLVVDEKHDGNCLLRVWWGVRFLRTVWMVKGLIESQALSDNQQFYGIMSLEALEMLHNVQDSQPDAGAIGAESSDASVAANAPAAASSAAAGAAAATAAAAAAPAPTTIADDVGARIQHVVVGDDPPMLARSVTYSLLGMFLLWCLSWLWHVPQPQPAVVDDPVARLQAQLARVESRIDSLSAALIRVLQLPRDASAADAASILEALKSSELSSAAQATFDARVLLQRMGGDGRALETLQAAVNLLSPAAAEAHGGSWLSSNMSVSVSVMVAATVAVGVGSVVGWAVIGKRRKQKK
jgi:hypothetical protein